MPYRQVTRAGKAGDEIASHSRLHARRVAESATDRYRDRLPEGREFLDLYEYQIFLGEELVELRDELITLDDLHAAALQREHDLRQERRGWVTGVREDLLQLKKTAEGYWGPGASRKLFREAPRVPQDPAALYQFGLRARDTLTDPGFDLEPVQSGVAVNPRMLAAGLEPNLSGLGENMRRLHDAESAAKHTQSQKDEALEKVGVFNGKVIRFYESLFDLAGHPRLASRRRTPSPAASRRPTPPAARAPTPPRPLVRWRTGRDPWAGAPGAPALRFRGDPDDDHHLRRIPGAHAPG